ncbi:MAG: hypothetical protein H6558_08350 [Lewinellaceae bacterium]|nr:hypothetical protein [Lewinellaceae bacterium]
MKNFSLPLLLLIPIGLLTWTSSKPAGDPPPGEDLFFELALQLLLTENYQEAEAVFSRLAADHPDNAAIHANRGVNQAMWGLSLISEPQAQELIKYVFPFEVQPNSGQRGDISDEKLFIGQCFEQAMRLFERSIELQPEDPGGYLNLASAQALRSRWAQDPALLRAAFRSAEQALAKAGSQSITRGYGYIVQGIIYDYLGNGPKRDDAFQLAWSQHQAQPDTKLASLVQRNQAVTQGGSPIFVHTGGEQFNVFEDQAEAIDGISLQKLMRSGNLEVSNSVADLGAAKIYEKHYPGSALTIYHYSESRFLFFHRTGRDYREKTMKGISIGQHEAYVQEAYGEPLRVLAAQGGKYLLYKKAKLLFFIDGDGRVQSWTVWRAKAS